MTETTTTKHEHIGKDDLNNHQLCFLMYEGMHYQDRQAYRELVQDAQHRCQQCGRTAKQSHNLCTPVTL